MHINHHTCVCAQLCLTLCGPVDCSSPNSSVHGIFQARILEWVAVSSSRGSFQPRHQTISLESPALAGGFFTSAPHGKPCSNFRNNTAVSMSKYSWTAERWENCCCNDVFVCAQLCSTLFDPKDCGPPGSSSVHGIFQARILKWVAISFSRGSSLPRDRTQVSLVSCIGRQLLYHCATWEAMF